MAQQKFEWANTAYNLHLKTPNDDELSTSKPIRTSWLTEAEKWLYQHIFSLYLYSICQTAFHKKLLGWTQLILFLLQSTKFRSLAYLQGQYCIDVPTPGALGVRWSLIVSSWSQRQQQLFATDATLCWSAHRLCTTPMKSQASLLHEACAGSWRHSKWWQYSQEQKYIYIEK